MSQNSLRNLAVTGASGHLGRRVVELLLESRTDHIVAITRHPEKIADLAARGGEIRTASFDDPGSLLKAFGEAERALIISTDVLDQSGRRLQQHRNAVDAAVRAGVKHVVYTSMPYPMLDSPIFFAPDHRGTEEALAASPLSWAVLRNYWYTDFLPMKLSPAVATGQLFSAAGEGGAAYITREDCARAAAAALASKDFSRRTLNVTGPAVVGYAELARIVSEISGRTVTYLPLSPQALIDGMLKAGVPEMFAGLAAGADLAMAKGYMGPAAQDFTELTGRKPTPVAEFLGANRAALVDQAGRAVGR
jgi:NAD(P)H dehydrogenase (quinone)